MSLTHSCISLQPSPTTTTSSFPLPKPTSLRLLKLNNNNNRSTKVNAVYSNGPRPKPRHGVWSIRDDLISRSEKDDDVVEPISTRTPVYATYGDSPFVADSFPSVINHLFHYRIIRCGGEVDDDMANFLISQLLYLDAVDPHKDIVMYINSAGGSVTAGTAIYDVMRHIRPDVSTVCVGLAASMAAFLLAAGTKGKRFCLPNSRVMIHQPLAGLSGNLVDMDIQINEILHHKATLNGYLSYFTGQPVDKVMKDTERDFFMNAKQAKEYGLIDGIITNPFKAMRATSADQS